MSRRWIGLAAVLALGAFILPGCATNPVTGKRELSLVSSDQELAIGRDGYEAVVAEYGLYDDPRLQAYVDSIGQRLAKVSHLPNLSWHFTVLDDATVNAFAMPGGYIYITRGILAHLNSEAQLAGVLGHEIGHVTARHSAQRLTQQQLAGVGLQLASIVSTGFRRYSGAAEQALGLLFLKYGRDDENQADQLGVDYAARAAFDPREIPATYAMLKRVSDRAGQRLPSFLSTHPDPGDREIRTAALAQAAAAGKTGLVINARSYVRRQDGVPYGPDPRQGYLDGAHYYHPGLAFQITLPVGWKYQDTRAALAAMEPNEQAVMQLTLVTGTRLSPAEYVAELQSSGKVLGVRGATETIGGWPAWAGQIRAVGKDETELILAAALARKSPEVMFRILGRSATPGDENEQKILQSARSLRQLTDAAKLTVQPDRVKVVAVPSGGTFETVVKALGPQAVDLEETAILNNAEAGQDVRTGELVKIVVSGRAR